MAKRRGRGEGSIRQRADGRWEVRVDLGRGLDGARQQKSVFAETERAAIAVLKKLHARTVGGHVLAHAVLRSALADAVRLQLVAMNAATMVKVPTLTKRPITALDVTQAQALLAVAGQHRLSALFSVALACGLRLGEATGLRWDDVSLETGEVQIRQQLQKVGKQLVLQPLKTTKSRRTLVLPGTCVTALKEHRTRQLAERLKAGPRWVDSGLVFTTYRTTKEGKGQAMKVGAPCIPGTSSARCTACWRPPSCRG